MKKRHGYLCYILFLLFLNVLTINTNNGSVSSERVLETEDTTRVLSYTPSDPILIQSNGDFETQGWPGEGTIDQPYLISGLNIITNGTCINIRTTDVYFIIEDCILITDNTVASDAIQLWHVENATISNCNVKCRIRAILTEHCETCIFNNNIISDCERGVVSTDISGCSFISNTCFNISLRAFYLSFSDGNEFINNSVIDSSDAFILTQTSTNSLVNNKVMNCAVGFSIGFSPYSTLSGNNVSHVKGYAYSLYSSSNSVLQNNIACGNSDNGININTASNIHIIDNSVSGSRYCGISLGGASAINNSLIQGNRVFSGYFGIYIFRGQDNILFENAIGAHNTSLARDNGENNIWDDSISKGNYWYGYSGEGVYQIPGAAGAVDRFPQQLMVFESEPNHAFESGLVGHSIIWAVEEPFPSSYELYLNNELNESGVWDWTKLVILLDNLSPGSYNYTLVAFNELEMSVTDTVLVTLYPSEAPDIQSRPEDVVVTVGTSQTLVWTAQDYSPESYQIYLNGTLYKEEDWNGGSVSITETWDAISSYNYTVIFVDQLGHTSSDTVIVTVNEGTVNEGGSLGIPILILIIGIVAGCVATALVVIYVSKYRK